MKEKKDIESNVFVELKEDLIEVVCVFDLIINVAELIHLKKEIKAKKIKFFMTFFEFKILNK
jgi:hypothetical protein